MNRLPAPITPAVEADSASRSPVPPLAEDTVALNVESKPAATAGAEPAKPARKAVARKAPAKQSAPTSKPAPAQKSAAVKAAPEKVKRVAVKKNPSGPGPVPAKVPAAAEARPKALAQASKDSTKPRAASKPAKKAAKSRSQMVRDSFTMPEDDFALIASLKARALGARRAAKKSELLRAGLRLLSGLEAKALVAALDQLAPVKLGRPKKGH